MNILILGGGGREHAIARQISLSPKCNKLFVAPGNAGTTKIATNIPLAVTDFNAVKAAVIDHNINMLIVGPEQPLVEGIYDFFQADDQLTHVNVIGPSKKGAELEGSKERAKEFMTAHQIPTAAYKAFTAETLVEGQQFLEELQPPYVLKADGLAGGKGVLILNELAEAKQELANMLTAQKFGEASSTVVIEEFLDGIELSLFALTDGESYKILPTAKDYKRIGEGDTGLNTGGMGAVSPVNFADDAFMKKVEQQIVKPTIEGLHKENIPYKGFVFFGLIKVGNNPYVIEYNVRMGDPETEVVMPRIKSDLVETLEQLGKGQLDQAEIAIDERHTGTVMLVSGGYPEAYEKGKEISGLNCVENDLIYHAGTRLDNNKVLTNGGRVIAVTAYGETYKKALSEAYRKAEKITFDKVYYRKDLGKDLEHID